MFGRGSKPTSVAATCESSRLTVEVKPDTWVDATFPNSPPTVRGLVARSRGEAVTVRAADVELTVSAIGDDPDRDTLTARWATNSGPIAAKPVEGAPGLSLRWTPTMNAPDLEVLVGDGRDGYDREPIKIPESAPAPPVGRVRSLEGAEVPGATLVQGPTPVTADAGGAFELPAWDAAAPLVVSAPGFVDRVVTADRAPTRFPLQLLPCERVTHATEQSPRVSVVGVAPVCTARSGRRAARGVLGHTGT